MKFNLAVPIVLTVAVCCINFSCTKKGEDQTQVTRLENKWKLAEMGFDDNGNGVIDPSEIQPVSAKENDVLQFLTNGTGTEVETGIAISNLTFTWSISSTDTITRIGTGHDTIIYYLANISSTNLELTTTIVEDSNETRLVAYYYNID